jgi:ribosomal protein S18 acetylase RimI-like enzyme
MAREANAAASEGQVVFRPIALPGDALLSVQFSEDAFVCSFGTAERFWAEAGRDGRKWIARLVEKLEQDERLAVNAWLGGSIVGQIVLGESETQPDAGHVNLYYLVPRYRGRGLAQQLDAYACAILSERGYSIATLNVSPRNTAAVRFYLRSGWRRLGPRVDAPYVDTMEKTLRRAPAP